VRFVFAIVAFVLAAAMIGLGIAQRTIFAPEDRVTAGVAIDGTAAFTVVDGSVLNSNPGQQRLTASGSDTVFAAYARTTDIEAWLADEPYNSIGYDAETGDLTSEVVTADPVEAVEGAEAADEVPLPAPSGSDLWLEETSAQSSLSWTVNVPDDVSLLLASDGTAPAPSSLTVSWPVVHSTPWAGPLIIGGGILLLVGLALYIWGLIHMRRTRGPRRKSQQPKMPKLPQPPRFRGPRQPALEPETTAKGRRSSRRMTAVVVGVASVALLAGCTSPEISEYFGEAPAPSPTASASAEAEQETTPVAVTQPQVTRILASVSQVATDADASLDAALLQTRFAGPALQVREANYTMRGRDGGIIALDAIPAQPIRVDLPEATDTWPRRLLAVVGGDDEATAPTAMMLVQQSPRENYRVNYAVRLQAGVEFPPVAPATIGAAVVAPDVRLLSVPPGELSRDYADVLAAGDSSQYAPLFSAEGDSLRTNIVDGRNGATEALAGSAANITFGNQPGTGPVIAMATNDSGAIVAVDVLDLTSVSPSEAGSTINTTGAVAALSGITSTGTGVESTYGVQVLFYVPPSTDESAQVQVLGYAQGLISVREL
jgi:hypothetical protein